MSDGTLLYSSIIEGLYSAAVSFGMTEFGVYVWHLDQQWFGPDSHS